MQRDTVSLQQPLTPLEAVLSSAVVTAAPASELLYARLQLVAPGARTVLIAPARSSVRAAQIAQDLLGSAQGAGQSARLVDLGAVPSSEVSTAESARQTLNSFDGLTVVLGGGLLDSPWTLLVAAVVDAVVVVARRGRSSRLDLDQVRREVERAGGKIVGAVLTQ